MTSGKSIGQLRSGVLLSKGPKRSIVQPTLPRRAVMSTVKNSSFLKSKAVSSNSSISSRLGEAEGSVANAQKEQETLDSLDLVPMRNGINLSLESVNQRDCLESNV